MKCHYIFILDNIENCLSNFLSLLASISVCTWLMNSLHTMDKEKRIEDKSKLLNIESKKVQFKKHERLKNIKFSSIWILELKPQ